MRRKIVNVAFHRLIGILENPFVSAIDVELPRDHDERGIPRRTVPPGISPASGRNDSWKVSVVLLLIAQVSDPFFIGGCVFPVIHCLFTRQLGVSGPSVLFAVRAIGGIPIDKICAV